MDDKTVDIIPRYDIDLTEGTKKPTSIKKGDTINEIIINRKNMDENEACSCKGISTQKILRALVEKSIIPSCMATRYIVTKTRWRDNEKFKENNMVIIYFKNKYKNKDSPQKNYINIIVS